MDAAAIARRLAAGRWVAVFRGVYAIAGVPLTFESRVMAACLKAGPGAATSHRTAATLLGLRDFGRVIDIASARRVEIPGVIVHRTSRLERRDIRNLAGLPVTTAERTLCDLGNVADREQVEDALDAAARKGLTIPRRLLERIQGLGTRGCKGPALLRSLLEGADGKPPSWLERRFVRLLQSLRLDRYEREQPVLGGRYRIDFAWPSLKLGIEVHSSRWHFQRVRWARDLARHNEITACGWILLHFTWDQIRDRPEEVRQAIEDALRPRLDLGRV
jgi:very-short-patch-repair endonuclease